jgi:Protein of unknown function (DUF3500)
MNHESMFYCPDCDDGSDTPHSLSRRSFFRQISGGAAVALATTALPAAFTAESAAKAAPKPAENLIRELYATLSAEQKTSLVLPWNHQGKDGQLSRLGSYNSAYNGKRIGKEYTKPQQDLVQQALRSILSGDESFERLSRDGDWDSSGSFEGCGSTIFGDPSGDKEFAWLFTGHHLTLRCDGNSMPGAAFGGPIYYGHSETGNSPDNVYYYQTQQVQSVFDALDAGQQKQALGTNPGDGPKGIAFPKDPAARSGIAYQDLNASQRELVEKVMRTLLDPFRKEDGNEVMEIVKANGGMEKIRLSFSRDQASKEEKAPWHFWRLEGPGFIWNYRVLPHVHCFVNIANLPVAVA